MKAVNPPCPLLFEGLNAQALDDVLGHMRPRHFASHEVLCRQGEPGGALFLIEKGVVEIVLDRPDGPRSVARGRRGEVIGELSLVTGEPRSATVVANVPTDVLELDRQSFATLLARHPVLLSNLTTILSQRLVHRNLRPVEDRRRGEFVALIVGPAGAGLAADIVAAARAASPRSVAALDLASALPTPDVPLEEPTAGGVLSVIDDLLRVHGAVIVVVGMDQEDSPLLLKHTDRVVFLTTEDETRRLTARLGPAANRAEVVLLQGGPPCAVRSAVGLSVLHCLDPDRPDGGIAWIGRHLSRTKLGLALGAGGAKGYAHVAAIQVLEQAGYTVDYVAGSSIGAMVGAWLALGRSGSEIESAMRTAFTADRVAAMFKLSMSGLSTGLDVHTQVCRESTDDRSFDDLVIPLVAMAVDLNTRRPAPIRDGPLWQALLASTALAGLFPPYQRGTQRLVDGLALVPVPTGSVIEDGADVTVSVNIMSRETLPAWPGEEFLPPPPRSAGSRMLDTLLEVMDLAQLDASVRHATLADVVVTPRFGPSTWRDFHRADQFLAAGRVAAEEQLGSLRAWLDPNLLNVTTEEDLMDQPFTFADLKTILVNRVGLPEEEVKDDPDATFESMGLDSLAFVEIQLAMQQEYGFTIPDEDAHEITTVGQAIAYTNRRIQETRS